MRSYDLLCRKMSEDLDAVIMSVDYRLAPDAVFPDQYHDALAASRAFLSTEVLQRYSIDPERVCVSGDSAGGNLAAAAAQEMKETFARSSVSCLTGSDLHSIPAVRGDPCWQVTQQLHLLIEKSVSQRYQRLISTAVKDEVSRVLPSLVMDDRASPRPKVAAHVTGSFAPKLEHDEGGPVSAGRRVQGQKISWWEGRKGLAFLQDVQLVDGELVVSQPGLYYVYAQTYFRHTHSLEEDGEEVGDRGKPLLQYVYKKVSSYPVPILLMKTSRTSCWSRGSDFSLHSAHQGGLFPLTTGDRLFVTVTNASAVDMDEKSSFFGAFLIS